jgi:PmbA protein
VYDSFTAAKEGRKSDGHASSALGTWGPHASNLFLSPGENTLDELLQMMGQGILVTRFHYTNVIHPIETSFTGMTRDGTFWVEGGRPVRPIKNLRFTQNILEALNGVRGAGKDLWRFNTACVPALLIDRFRFTGVTDF